MPRLPDQQSPVRLALALTSQERELLLTEIEVSPAIRQRLRMELAVEGANEYRLSVDELESLIETLGAEFDMAQGRQRRDAIDRMGRRIAALLYANLRRERDAQDEGHGEAAGHLSLLDALPGDLRARLAEAVGSAERGDLELLNDCVEEVISECNARPQEGMGGLSPVQVFTLLHAPWGEAGSPIRLNDCLSLEELADSYLLHCARLLLAEIGKASAVKATKSGNLNRESLRLLFSNQDVIDLFGYDFSEIDKPINERDIRTLHIVRVLLGLAGLLKSSKGTIQVTRKGQKLARPEQAGPLLALLFKTYFTKMNMSYGDRLPDCDSMQATVAYSIFRLSQLAGDWSTLESMTQSALLPNVREELGLNCKKDETRQRGAVDAELWLYVANTTFWQRVVTPLNGFGLLELRSRERRRMGAEAQEARKTPLFDRFLTYDWA